MVDDIYYKDKDINDICPNCKKYGDVSKLLEGKSKFGIYRYCKERCGYKITLKKFLTRAEKFAKKFPVNKELRKIRLKEMRESRKNVTFKTMTISLLD